MSLRTKLLLLALSTLVLPLSGWLLLREFEAQLREGQAQVQLASAQMLARAVAMRPEVLPAAGSAFFVQGAEGPLVLDGYDGDWREQGLLDQSPAPGLRVALARSSSQLYLFIAVADRSRVRADAHWSQAASADQIILVIEDDTGIHRLRLASAAPGPLVVKPLDDQSDRTAPRLTGEWQEDAQGYQVEARFMPGYSPIRMGIETLDFTDAALAPRRQGTGADLEEGRWPLQQSPEALQVLLEQLMPDGVRASVTQADGWVLARAGRFIRDSNQNGAGVWRELLHRMLAPDAPPESSLQRAGARGEMWQALAGRPAFAWYASGQEQGLMLATAVPIEMDGQIRGAVLLERQSASLVLGGQALARLILLSVFAMLAVGLVLFAFAGRLSSRIRALSRAAERAIVQEGRDAPAGFVASRAGDELGDLSRSFGRLLEEVGAYSDYLRGLAGTLSHELHTPIAVVRSSLENLEAETLPVTARTYVERARAGVDRLGAIVRAMSEASRVERAIASAEAEDFDLCALVADCAEGYRALLAPRSLQTMLPPAPIGLHGAPDLIVQALDKLVDNARSFCPPDGWVLIALAQTAKGMEIVVANAGPTLPATMQERLFDSLVSLRGTGQRGDGAPHLGFGLHVVRLIAQRHRGFARAANLPQGDGVEFRMVVRDMVAD